MRRSAPALPACCLVVLGGAVSTVALTRAAPFPHAVAPREDVPPRARASTPAAHGLDRPRVPVRELGPSRGAEPAPAPLEPGAAAALARVREAARDPSAAGSACLRRAVNEEDPVVRIEAIGALVDRREVEAIDEIAHLDVGGEDPAGRTIAAALGALGARADARGRGVSLDRLFGLLRAEHARAAPDGGNILVLVEAIGDLGDPRGAPALEAELGRAPLDVGGWTTVVRALAAIGTHENVPALERLRALAPSSGPKGRFGRELRGELASTIDEAIAELSQR